MRTVHLNHGCREMNRANDRDKNRLRQHEIAARQKQEGVRWAIECVVHCVCLHDRRVCYL